MDSDFSEKLRSVLSDPDAMAKITAIASNLGKASPDTSSTDAPKTSEDAQSVPKQEPSLPLTPSDPRLALLYSLKPLLREDKRSKIDSLTKALTIASMMKQFRK